MSVSTPISNVSPSSPSAPVDYAAVKTKQQAMWSSGDFAVIGTTLQLVGEELCEALDLLPGQRVLDVACGNGHAALAAARRYGEVTGLDYVPALLERARERARAERAEICFVEGDAEKMPFEDDSFDVVLSTYGVMFAPDQERAARELTRVCAPGGKIGLASWTPEGMIGDRAPIAHAQRKNCVMRYRSADHFVDVFRRFYGPTYKAFEALPPEGQRALEKDLLAMLARHNRAGEKALVAPAEYLEIVAEVQ